MAVKNRIWFDESLSDAGQGRFTESYTISSLRPILKVLLNLFYLES